MEIALRFWRAESGVAAVEFVLVTPLLVAMMFGVVELTDRMSVRWDAEAYNYQVGDYLSRADDLAADDFDEVYDIRFDVIQTVNPSVTEVSFRVVSIGFDTTNDPVLLWDESRGPTPPSFDLSQAEGLGVHGQSVVFAVTRVKTPALVTRIGGPNVDSTKQSFFRPRITRAIALNGSLTEGGAGIEGYY